MRVKSLCLILPSVCGCLTLSAHDNYSWNNHWELLGDFVYMRRNDIHDKTLVKDKKKRQSKCPGACPDFTVINTKNLVNDLGFEPGYRVGLTYMVDPKMGFEWNFLYIYPWQGSKEVHGHHSLSFPFSHKNFTHDFHNADKAHAEYESRFWDLEFNYWCYFTPRRVDYFSLSGLIGLRYFHWDEKFELKMFRPPDRSSYDVRTENRIFGVQFGLDFQMNPVHWLSWEIFAKVGGMVDHSEQKTFLGDMDNDITLHSFKRQGNELGMYADVAAEFVIHAHRHLDFRAGYQAMFFSGLTLAPEQVSYRSKKNAGNRVYDHGTAVIHGLFVGLIVGF